MVSRDFCIVLEVGVWYSRKKSSPKENEAVARSPVTLSTCCDLYGSGLEQGRMATWGPLPSYPAFGSLVLIYLKGRAIG